MSICKRLIFLTMMAFVGTVFPAGASAVPLVPGDIVVAIGGDTIIRIDPVTGDRSIFSDNTHGSGPSLIGAGEVAFDPQGNLIVIDGGNRDFPTEFVVRIDPITGDREIVTGGTIGSGPSVGFVESIAVNREGTIFLTDESVNALFSVDPVTGARAIVSSSFDGQGSRINEVGEIAVERSGTVLVGSLSGRELVRVDPVSGVRTTLANSPTGIETGDPSLFVFGVAIDADDMILFTEYNLDTVFRVHPLTGNLTVVSDATTGSGPVFLRPWGIDVEENGSILVADGHTILRVDPTSGDRVVLSGVGVGDGPSLAGVTNVAVVPVPEPTSLTLAALGVICCVFRWSRRRR